MSDVVTYSTISSVAKFKTQHSAKNFPLLSEFPGADEKFHERRAVPAGHDT
jgi:hypothetical protein